MPNTRANETRMAKNMPARDRMNSRRSKPPENDKARKQLAAPPSKR